MTDACLGNVNGSYCITTAKKIGKPLRQTANLRGFVFSQLHDHILPKLIARVLKKKIM